MIETVGFSDTLMKALRDRALAALRSAPPFMTNAMFIAAGVRTLDELAAQGADHVMNGIRRLAGREGRPTVEAFERCATEGSVDGLDLLINRMFCECEEHRVGRRHERMAS